MDRLVSLFYAQALQVLCHSADTRYPDHRLPVPVRFILDDFATNAVIPDFDNITSVIRSRNISVSIILQSITQLNAIYGAQRAATITNNCDNCLYLGGQDPETARFISVKANKPVSTILGMGLEETYLFTRGQQPRSVPGTSASASSCKASPSSTPSTAPSVPPPSPTTATTACIWAGRIPRPPGSSASRPTSPSAPFWAWDWRRPTCSPVGSSPGRWANSTCASTPGTASSRSPASSGRLRTPPRSMLRKQKRTAPLDWGAVLFFRIGLTNTTMDATMQLQQDKQRHTEH